jgi:hypothetical protein
MTYLDRPIRLLLVVVMMKDPVAGDLTSQSSLIEIPKDFILS